MAYAYWKSGKREDVAVFDLFFRNNPFQGEFTIFAGLEEVLKFLDHFHYSDSGKLYFRFYQVLVYFFWSDYNLKSFLILFFRYCLPYSNSSAFH